jgi:predicted ester cyclase
MDAGRDTAWDKVAARFIMRRAYGGTFLRVSAGRKTIAVQVMKFYRLSGGHFVEEHGQSDMLALLKQIGAVPTA